MDSANADPQVTAAFVEGWHVAQLYHRSVIVSGDDDITGDTSGDAAGADVPGAPDDQASEELPGLEGLPEPARYALQVRMVAAGINALCPSTGDPKVDPSVQGTAAELAEPLPDQSKVSQQVYALHVRILESLTVADFRLGKAYSLGRALAETVIIPARADDASFRKALAEMFDADRVNEMVRWLAALKSQLPPHAAYAVSRTLQIWKEQPARTSPDTVPATKAALASQGRVWRAVLSGEKRPADLLSEGDYVRAAEALSARFRNLAMQFFRHYRWALFALMALAVLIIAAIIALTSWSGASKVVAVVVTGAAAVGISMKTAASAVGKVASHVSQPIWDSEVDESIAIAATRLPRAAPAPDRITGDDVGRLRPNYDPPRLPNQARS